MNISITRWKTDVLRNIVARSLNHRFNGNSKMHNTFNVERHGMKREREIEKNEQDATIRRLMCG